MSQVSQDFRAPTVLDHNPALMRRDWLPAGVWPELDALREKHVRLLDTLYELATEAAALRQTFEAEDAAHEQTLQAALRDGTNPALPKVTPAPKREAAHAEVRKRHEAAIQVFAQFCEEAIREIQAHEKQWVDDLDARSEEADRRLEEMRRAVEEADRARRELVPLRHWINRTARNRPGLHIHITALGVPSPDAELNLKNLHGVVESV